jgi:hypothetical protein
MPLQRRVGKGSILLTMAVKQHSLVGNATAFAHPTKKSRVVLDATRFILIVQYKEDSTPIRVST